MRIQSETLIKSGTPITVELGSNAFDAMEFRNSSVLLDSILTGLQNNSRVPERVVNQFVHYIESSDKSKIVWNSDITPEEINELGKYLGEMLPGVLLLDRNWSSFDTQFMKIPRRFAVPTDCSFSGIDSFFTDYRGNSTMISSKYGPGARASVFSNLLPIAMDKKLGESQFKNLIAAAEEAGIDSETLIAKQGSKNVLYTYGINQILGLNHENPIEIFNDIRNHCINKTELKGESKSVLDKINSTANNMIVSALPHSTTSFFARTTAERLNEDKKSIEQMKEVLQMKDFVQLNMNMTKWRQGDIQFKVRRSSEADIKIGGNKSAVNDLDARQGSLVYELK